MLRTQYKHADRCTCRHGKICKNKRSQAARQELFEAPDIATRQYDSLRQGVQSLFAVRKMDTGWCFFCLSPEIQTKQETENALSTESNLQG